MNSLALTRLALARLLLAAPLLVAAVLVALARLLLATMLLTAFARIALAALALAAFVRIALAALLLTALTLAALTLAALVLTGFILAHRVSFLDEFSQQLSPLQVNNARPAARFLSARSRLTGDRCLKSCQQRGPCPERWQLDCCLFPRQKPGSYWNVYNL
jgi:hypothetical protein